MLGWENTQLGALVHAQACRVVCQGKRSAVELRQLRRQSFSPGFRAATNKGEPSMGRQSAKTQLELDRSFTTEHSWPRAIWPKWVRRLTSGTKSSNGQQGLCAPCRARRGRSCASIARCRCWPCVWRSRLSRPGLHWLDEPCGYKHTYRQTYIHRYRHRCIDTKIHTHAYTSTHKHALARTHTYARTHGHMHNTHTPQRLDLLGRAMDILVIWHGARALLHAREQRVWWRR
jgi:hypothetical protein